MNNTGIYRDIHEAINRINSKCKMMFNMDYLDIELIPPQKVDGLGCVGILEENRECVIIRIKNVTYINDNTNHVDIIRLIKNELKDDIIHSNKYRFIIYLNNELYDDFNANKSKIVKIQGLWTDNLRVLSDSRYYFTISEVYEEYSVKDKSCYNLLYKAYSKLGVDQLKTELRMICDEIFFQYYIRNDINSYNILRTFEYDYDKCLRVEMNNIIIKCAVIGRVLNEREIEITYRDNHNRIDESIFSSSYNIYNVLMENIIEVIETLIHWGYTFDFSRDDIIKAVDKYLIKLNNKINKVVAVLDNEMYKELRIGNHGEIMSGTLVYEILRIRDKVSSIEVSNNNEDDIEDGVIVHNYKIDLGRTMYAFIHALESYTKTEIEYNKSKAAINKLKEVLNELNSWDFVFILMDELYKSVWKI